MTEPMIVEPGPSHRIVEWQTQMVDRFGATLTYTNSYTELASGMHYLDDQNTWQKTVAEFIPVAEGFIAHRGPHQVALATDLTVAGAVTIVTSDGRFISTLYCILLVALSSIAQAASFRNLNFQSPNVRRLTYPEGLVSDIIIGWQLQLGGQDQQLMFYNDLCISCPSPKTSE